MNLPAPHDFRYVLVTTMKDECPYILDWLGYHFSIGFTHAVIMTNDCSDGTDKLCRNLENLGVVTHMNNKAPHPKGVQKTAWSRAQRLTPVQSATWLMALDVDEYLYLEAGDGHIEDTLALFERPPMAISFVWQIFGNQGVKHITDTPVTQIFKRASHPLQAKPYIIRGFKTLFQNVGFEEIGTHRPHKTKPENVEGTNWVNGDGAPINILFNKPYWCVWDNGFLGGGALGRVNHYALRSKEAFMLKMKRGFVNRTGRGVRSEKSPLRYWHNFDWNIVENQKIIPRIEGADDVKFAMLSQPKIERLHRQGLAFHQEAASALEKIEPEFTDEFKAIFEMPPNTEVKSEERVFNQSDISPLFETRQFKNNCDNTLIKLDIVNKYYYEIDEKYSD